MMKNYKRKKPKNKTKWNHYGKSINKRVKSFDDMLQDFMENSNETQKILKNRLNKNKKKKKVKKVAGDN